MRTFTLSISLIITFCANAQDSTNRFVNERNALPINTFKQAKPGIVPANFYTTHLGFFCRQELLLTKKNIPVHFRLGSMEYCNYLEQKPGYTYDPTHK